MFLPWLLMACRLPTRIFCPPKFAPQQEKWPLKFGPKFMLLEIFRKLFLEFTFFFWVLEKTHPMLTRPPEKSQTSQTLPSKTPLLWWSSPPWRYHAEVPQHQPLVMSHGFTVPPTVVTKNSQVANWKLMVSIFDGEEKI